MAGLQLGQFLTQLRVFFKQPAQLLLHGDKLLFDLAVGDGLMQLMDQRLRLLLHDLGRFAQLRRQAVERRGRAGLHLRPGALRDLGAR